MPAHKQRRSARRIQRLRHAQHVVLVDNDRLRIAAISRPASLLLDAAIGAGHTLLAELLLTLPAWLAHAARIHDAADRGGIANLVARHMRTDGRNCANDFMAGHKWIIIRAPIAGGRVDIGVADPAMRNLDLHVVIADSAALKSPRRERFRATRRSES